MIETIKAAAYYKNKAPGVVVLVDGQPHHFTAGHGANAATRARNFVWHVQRSRESAAEQAKRAARATA